MTAPNYDDDLSNAYLRQRESRQASSDSEYLDNFISGGTQETAETAPRQEMNERETYDFFREAAKSGAQTIFGRGVKTAGKAALDIGEGVLVESPFQVIGGMEEGLVNAPLQAIHEFGTWANENLADLGEFSYTPETGLQFTSHAKAKEIAEQYGYDPNTPFALPVPAEADSVTGGIIRNISKYVSGFIGAGKVLKVAGLPAAATAAGKVGEFMLRGALADAIEFGPNDPRLSDLLQKVPALQNPVTEYLASDPEDGAAEGRFKNAVEGLGLGVAGIALEKVLGAVRAGIKAKAAARAVPGATEEAAQLPIRIVKRDDIETLLSDRPVQRALKLSEEGTTQPRELLENVPSLEVDEGKIFVNWARIDSDEDVKTIIRDLADAQAPDIEKARRGVQTWEQTQLNAAQEDAWKILTERRKGEPLGAQQSLAVRQLWVTSAEKVKSLAEEAVVNPSDANLFAFRKMMAIHNTIQKQVIAARTETARALNAWAIPAGSDVQLSRDIGDIIEFMGGTENSRKIAEKVAMLGRGGNAKELEAFIETSTWARTREAISAFWYAALLSGPKTHARNMLSNSFVAAQQIYERKAANLIGQMLGEENIVPGESMALLYGTIEGTKDALRVSAKGRRILREAGEVAMQGQEGREAARQMLAHGEGEFGTFYRSMATGQSGYGVGKLETPMAGAFSSEKWALDPESNIGKAMDMLDAVMSLPGRALMAEDELFKTIGYRAELHAQAHRKVAQEIASGALENTPEAMKARAAEIILDPNETIRLAAMDAAAYRTFTQRAGPLASGLSHAINNPKLSPYLRGLGIIVWPFRRTPSGIFRYGFERTPLAPMFKHVQADLSAGGAQRDLALARMATGSVLLAAAMDLAMSGHVTGQGPANPNQRATMRRMGIQPDSFKVGDRYFSYRGTEPVSQTLGIAANIVEILKNTDWEDDNVDVQRMFIAAAISIGYQTTSATYMQGLSDFFDAMGDPVRYGEGYFQKLARSFVPAASAEVTRFIDPNMRAVEDMIDAMYARTPGLSKTLPLNHDAWGHPKSYRSGLGTIYDAMSPSYSSKANASDIDKELNRLELWNGKPPKRVSFSPDMIRGIPGSGSVSVNLSKYPEAYERYVELQGDLMTHTADGAPIDASGLTQFQSLNALVSGVHPLSVSYGMGTEGSDGQKATMIRSIRDKFRRAARAQLLNEFPELRQEVIRRMPQEWIGQ